MQLTGVAAASFSNLVFLLVLTHIAQQSTCIRNANINQDSLELPDEGYIQRSISKKHEHHDVDHDHQSSHDHDMDDHDHIDPLLYVFFTLRDLKRGKTMPIYFPYTNPSSTPKLLPKEEADAIPFSSSQLENLLQLFSLSKHSPQAKAVEYTLTQCELESIKGETKFCATSLESMIEFARVIIGESPISVLATTRLSNSTILLQNYTVLEQPIEIFAPKVVACHSMPYPYAVFYCHCQDKSRNNRVFEISLGAENGDRVKAIAICHMDTSQWDPDHASFGVLKTQPGGSHVCHFVSPDSLVWVPN